ncbi:MAG: histidinol dehydrogenase [Eudoraea sp.]
MKTYTNPPKSEWNQILKRPTTSLKDIEGTVIPIFEEIAREGDKAVHRYTKQFDKATLRNNLVSSSEIEAAKTKVSVELKEAINIAKANIEKFHRAQITDRIEVETTDGVVCWQEKRPIQKVGLYIPGGTAPLFSTILMLAVPAYIAGCSEIILCSPPDQYGNINPVILYTAALCGVKKIYKVGGIQAIAAMTFGTESISKVYKIFGPGNQYVTVAKQLATKYGVAIDMPAGPSELLVVSDNTGIPSFIASDLLSQAEHGKDSQVIFVSTDLKLIEAVNEEVLKQLQLLPRRDIAQKAIENSKLIYVENDQIAIDLINEYGPEHFIVCSKNEAFYCENIINAGSVFLGNYTPESAGDYASGTNHTLPTNGYAKQYSGVNLDSFMKSMTFQKLSSEGLKKLGKTIELMAGAEGLEAHKNAVSIRLKELEKKEKIDI